MLRLIRRMLAGGGRKHAAILGLSGGGYFRILDHGCGNRHLTTSTTGLSGRGHLASTDVGFITRNIGVSGAGNEVIPSNFLCKRPFSTSMSADNEGMFDQVSIGCGDTTLFLRKLDKGMSEIGKSFKLSSLKASFEKDVRPYLPEYLIFPRPLDTSVEQFHRKAHALFAHSPIYLSSHDAATVKQLLSKQEWSGFLDHIIINDIIVACDPLRSYGSIETLIHTKGPDDPSHSFKGESDGSFNEQTKKAKLSFSIFIDGILVGVDVLDDVDCPSSVVAEIYAAIALQFRLIELKLSRGVVWTDSKVCYGVMSGEYAIRMEDPNRDLFLLLRSLRVQFQSLVTLWKPRELLSLTDSFIRVTVGHVVLRRDIVKKKNWKNGQIF